MSGRGGRGDVTRRGGTAFAQLACVSLSAIALVGTSGTTLKTALAHSPASSAGPAWTATTAPLSGLNPPAPANPYVYLRSVSCPGRGSCVAVGWYAGSAGYSGPGLIETFSGGTWKAATAPLTGLSPAAGAKLYANLFAVSCKATGSCVAVGDYVDSSGHYQGLIETLAGGKWTPSRAPTSGLSPTAGSNPGVTLESVSCTAAGSCLAGGNYLDTSFNQLGLIETFSSGTWKAATAPLSGLSPAAGTTPYVNLYGPNCPATGSCFLVGSYDDSSGDTHGLIETLSGGTWTASTAPLPGGAASNPNAGFTGMSCPAAGSCVAAGRYVNSTGNFEGLIETLSGGTWTPSTASLGGLTPPAGTYAVLYGVSCTATGACVAGGNYDDTSGIQQGLFETLSVRTWTPSTAPLTGLNPAPASSPNVFLLGASCPAPGSCVLVGQYAHSSSNQEGLIESQPAALAPTVTRLSPTSGPAGGGTVVTVYGSNLTGASSVRFGTKSATHVSVVNSGELKVTAPSGTGTVDVTVTTPGGTSAISSKDRYSYFIRPSVSSLSPASGPAAGGNRVAVYGSNLTGASSLRFGTKSATHVSVVNSGELKVTAPSGTGTVDVTVTTPGGTSAISSKDRYKYS